MLDQISTSSPGSMTPVYRDRMTSVGLVPPPATLALGEGIIVGIGMAIYRISPKNGARGGDIPLCLVERQLLPPEGNFMSEPPCLLHEMERSAPSTGVDFEIMRMVNAIKSRPLPSEDHQGIHRNRARFQSNREDQNER